MGCPAGIARLTPGFALPATYILHPVGPVWQGGG
ncbi:macro domain-containing protein [Aquitalea magnusonii]